MTSQPKLSATDFTPSKRSQIALRTRKELHLLALRLGYAFGESDILELHLIWRDEPPFHGFWRCG